jgi:toxin-antitoxin system PIN domain toxin
MPRSKKFSLRKTLSAPSDVPDVSVWLALTDPDHTHHRAARHYWDTERTGNLVFLRVTFFGLLRLLTNTHVMDGRPFSPAESWRAGQTYLALPEISLLPDPPEIDGTMEAWTAEPFFNSKLWTDAWIAASAVGYGYRLVSFDTDFGKFPGLNFLHLKP